MKIRQIRAYQVDLPIKAGAYKWADQSFAVFDSTVVVIETDEGVTGAGESCPLGPSYLPAYSQGVRTGIGVLGPNLLGEDPTLLDVINHRMDSLLKGHPYVKSAIDMACWDIAGKAAGVPVHSLLGGSFRDEVRLFRVINRGAPEEMVAELQQLRSEGYVQFQMKVGDDADLDIKRIASVCDELLPTEVLAADANTSWKSHEALRVVNSAVGRPLYIEQPCLSYEECLRVRQHTNLPMILDESMTGPEVVVRGATDGAMDLINLKINKAGGLTRSRQIRDLCVQLGIGMTIEDTWGGEIASAAIAHLAHSTPPGFHFQSSPFHKYNDVTIADGGPVVADGHMRASKGPGLGVTPDFDVLGDPVLTLS